MGLPVHLPSPSFLQLISDAIHNMVVHESDFNTMDGHMTLTNRIAAVHVVYSFTCQKLHWFDQLTLQYPGIVYILLEEVSQMSPGGKDMVGPYMYINCSSCALGY